MDGGLAGAYSIVAHAVIFVPTTIIGLILLWSFGVSFRRISNLEVQETEGIIAP